MEYFVAGILVLAAGIKIYLWWQRKNDDYWKNRGVPFVPRMDLITVIRLVAKKPLHEIQHDAYKKNGRIYGEFEFRKPVITVCEPDLLRDILVKDFHVFHYRRDDVFGDPLLDKMVSVSKGEDWKRIRTIITPSFTSKRMRQMSHIINDSSLSVVETFKKHSDRGEVIDCKEVFGAFTMDVIASAAFGTKIDSHNDPNNIFVRHVKKTFLSSSIYQLMFFFFLPTCITRTLRVGFFSSLDFFKDVILQVIKERKIAGKRYNDFLQLLLDAQDELVKENAKELEKPNEQEDETDHFGSVTNNGIGIRLKYNKLTEDELVAQCVLFFMVGYETTASTLSFLAYCLAINPLCQEKLIKEVDDVFGKHEELNYDVIRDMKYLDCVVSETLRMYPILSRVDRTASEDYKLGKTGITIEKGVGVGFNIYAMHHDAEFFANPETFDPERFKAENISHPQYAYLPFGAGPRNCLGMRFALMDIKLCITNILRHYRLRKGPTTKVPIEYREGILLGAKEIHLLAEKRNDV